MEKYNADTPRGAEKVFPSVRKTASGKILLKRIKTTMQIILNNLLEYLLKLGSE